MNHTCYLKTSKIHSTTIIFKVILTNNTRSCKRYEKASAKLQKVNLEAEKYRKAEVVKSMVSSELIDENQKLKDDNEKKGDKIAGM